MILFFWQLELSEKLHCRSMPFKCFNEAGQLTAHERLNPGEKRYECKQCGKCLSDAGSLKRHNKVHTGEKSYECKQCGKCLSDAGSLKRHNKVHTGEKSYDLTSIANSAEDTTPLVKVCKNEIDLSQEVVNQFFSWTQDNAMACNPQKCNELILCKRVAHDVEPVNNITQVSCLKVLGVTLQSNHRFNEHIKVKLQEANVIIGLCSHLRRFI